MNNNYRRATLKDISTMVEKYPKHHLETKVVIAGLNDNRNHSQETEPAWNSVIKKDKTKFTPSHFIVPTTIESVDRGLAGKVELTNSPILNVLKLDSSVKISSFNKMLFPNH